MKERGITINELSEHTGISIPTLKRLRTVDDANPTLDNLIKLANFFNLSLDDLTKNNSSEDNGYNVPLLKYEQIKNYLEGNQNKAKTITVDTALKNVDFCFYIEKPMFSFSEGCVFYCSKQFKIKDGDFFISTDGTLNRLISNNAVMIALSIDQNSDIIELAKIYAKIIKIKYERHYE